MATNISEEEFLRLQNQLIELRTANYNLDERCAHQVAINRQLKSRVDYLEKECNKAHTSLNMARKVKHSELIQQNEALQSKLQVQEDEFRLQNQTLLQELSSLSMENEKLTSVINLTADEVESSINANEKVKKLRSEADALQRALSEERLRSAQEISKLRDILRLFTENIEEGVLNDFVGATGGECDPSTPEKDQNDSASLAAEAGSNIFDLTPEELQASKEKRHLYYEYITLTCREAQQELEDVKRKMEKLKTDYICEAMSAKGLQDKNEVLEKNLSDLDQEYTDYKIVTTSKISELENNLELVMVEQEKQFNIINNYNYKKNELEDQVQRLNKEMAENLMESELVHSQLIESTTVIEELKASKASLETENRELRKSAEETVMAIESKKGHIKELIASNKQLLTEYEEKIHHLENEKNQLEYKYKEQGEIVEGLKNSLDLAEKQNLEKETKIRDFEQQMVDLAAEKVLNEKKGAVICRDLKRQLASERRRVEKLQERLRDLLDTTHTKIGADGAKSVDVETTSNSSWSLMSGNMDPQESSTRESSLVAGSPTNLNGNSFPQPDEMDLELENRNLLERVTSLQEEKWVLEEKINHLEQGNAAMAEDLVKKSSVIKFYCMEGRTDPQPSSSGKKAVKKLSDFLKSSEEEHIQECNIRMQRMLEEVLTKDMYLQRDIEQMSQELEKLRLLTKPEVGS